ncbi:hypothetical protein ACHAWF_010071 [Thalassiosira exigua]
MKLKELQNFLSGCIDLGFTFPLNPKWVLCDEGWKALWDKLTGSTHPNVQLSINAWYPPGSQLKERIEKISAEFPDGFRSDLSARKKGTQAWDEAEIALDRYQRIQRAKRKLYAVLLWISIVQQSRKKVAAARLEEESAEDGGEEGEKVSKDEEGESQKDEDLKINSTFERYTDEDNDKEKPKSEAIEGESPKDEDKPIVLRGGSLVETQDWKEDGQSSEAKGEETRSSTQDVAGGEPKSPKAKSFAEFLQIISDPKEEKPTQAGEEATGTATVALPELTEATLLREESTTPKASATGTKGPPQDADSADPKYAATADFDGEAHLNSGSPDGNREDGLDNKKVDSPPEKRVSFQDQQFRNSLTSQKSNGSERISVHEPSHAEITKMGQMNQTNLLRASTDNPRPLRHSEPGPRSLSRARSEKFLSKRSSSSLTDEDEGTDVIDSLLSSDLPLTNYQYDGLQRLRDQLICTPNLPQSQIGVMMERRHTSGIDSRIHSMMLEDVPSFILKQYGGLKEDSGTDFRATVKKIMDAQRFLKVVGGGVEERHANSGQYLPIEWTSMSKETKKSLAEKLSFSALSNWEYNIMELAELCNGSPLLFIGWAIIGSPQAQKAMASDLGEEGNIDDADGYDFATEFAVQLPILCSFLRTVEADYLRNPYHNNTHAADVLQTLNTMLQLGGKDYATSPLDVFAILIAAVIHDVKHPGLNNNFQINSRSEIAVQFNDQSVLENYSIAWFFSKLLGKTRDFTVDILSGLSNQQFSRARLIIIQSVLETDMTHHFVLLKKMGLHQERLKCKPLEDWLKKYANEGVTYDPSMDMLCFLLHQADISNPAKPFPLFEMWADRILEESYAQGEQEMSLSLPVSPLCDRVVTNKKQSQIGFIKYVVQPSYRLLGDIIPLFARTVFPHIEKSLEYWDEYENDDDLS